MDLGAIIIIIIVAIVLVLTFYVIGVYNKLIDARNRVEDKFAQIDVELKKRANLIPNLIEIVKGYVKHEEKTLMEVVEARNKIQKAGNINDEIDASNGVSIALNKVLALAEMYPDLKASKNFLLLQEELKETEDKLSYARTFYNEAVLAYNNLRRQFPSNVVANIFKFKEISFFQADIEEKENIKMQF